MGWLHAGLIFRACIKVRIPETLRRGPHLTLSHPLILKTKTRSSENKRFEDSEGFLLRDPAIATLQTSTVTRQPHQLPRFSATERQASLSYLPQPRVPGGSEERRAFYLGPLVMEISLALRSPMPLFSVQGGGKGRGSTRQSLAGQIDCICHPGTV